MSNGFDLRFQQDRTLCTTQSEKIGCLRIEIMEESFRSQRALAQYSVMNCILDICTTVQLIAHGNRAVEDAKFILLRKEIDNMKETIYVSLDFVKLDLGSVRVAVLPDVSFANATGMESQQGLVILTADGLGIDNNVHYGSSRCHRLTRSVMAVEAHALVHTFEHRYVICDPLEDLMGRLIEIEAFVDSSTHFNTLEENNTAAERKLQIDVCALSDSYGKGDLNKMVWITERQNAADVLTKEIVSQNTAM